MGWCNWELRIDGKSCGTPSKIGVSMHTMNNDNDLIPVEVVGWCKNIGAGQHNLQVYVSRGTSNSDCYTGWQTHDYMEAWEPTAQEQAMMTYMQKINTDNGSDASNNILSTTFNKKKAGTHRASCTSTTCALTVVTSGVV